MINGYMTKLKLGDMQKCFDNHPKYSYGKKDKTLMNIVGNGSERMVYFTTEKDKPLAEGLLTLKDKQIYLNIKRRRNDIITAFVLTAIFAVAFFAIGFGLAFIGNTQMIEKVIFGCVAAAAGMIIAVILAIKYMRVTIRNAFEVFEDYLCEKLPSKQANKEKE